MYWSLKKCMGFLFLFFETLWKMFSHFAKFSVFLKFFNDFKKRCINEKTAYSPERL